MTSGRSSESCPDVQRDAPLAEKAATTPRAMVPVPTTRTHGSLAVLEQGEDDLLGHFAVLV
jgi:hypothetical protein